MKKLLFAPLLIAVIFSVYCLSPSSAYADIGRVYHPYVDPLEREIELRVTQSHDDLDAHTNLYNIGYGQAVNEKLFVEGYVIASDSDQSGADIEAYELEGLYQLTDKGAYSMDYGLLVELERENEKNINEVGVTLLLEKELGITSLATNLGISYEFGEGIDNEIDTQARLQWRYRFREAFQPALEVFLDEYDKSAGPAIMGLLRPARLHKIKWELGVLFALEPETPDTMLRAVLEYEF